MKPPADLLGLRLVVSNGSGYGKGGKEFDCSCDWEGGSILRFHQTVVLDDAADPVNGKLSFELKGNFKDAPAKDVSLGVGAIETKPKQKSRTLTLDLTNFSTELTKSGNKVKQVATICRLAVTLYHNKFPVDLAPDEIALRHKADAIKVKEDKKKKTAPSAREYNFLLSRRINWQEKNASSWNKDTENMLDEDVLKNLKDFQRSKHDENPIWNQLPQNSQRRWLVNNPKMAYAANRYNTPRSKVIVTPHRTTLVGVGFVGGAVNPVSTKNRTVTPGKAKILYKKRSTGPDAEEQLYNKLVDAEKRRLKRTKVKANRAHFQSSLDRAKAQIIARKVIEDESEDEKLRQLVIRSDQQLKTLRNEINRRKRRIAYLGLQKHISEADARKRSKQEKELAEKEQARHELEVAAAVAMKLASNVGHSTTPAKSKDPLNTIPLRRAPDTDAILRKKKQKLAQDRLQARRILAEEAEEAKAMAQVGKVYTSEKRSQRASSPSRKQLNTFPLRKTEEVSKRVQREREKKQEAAERRALAINAALAASEVMRDKYRSAAPYIAGVVTSNPYPLRKATTPKFTTVTSSGSHYDFSSINKIAQKDMDNDSDDNDLDLSGESEEQIWTNTEYPFTYTLKSGQIIKAKTMKELQTKMLQINRNKEVKRTDKLLKARARGLKGVSSAVTRSYKPKSFSPSKKKVATPIDSSKYKKFYDKGYNPYQEEPSEVETKELIQDLNNAVSGYENKSKEDWLRSSQGAMEVLTARSQELNKASKDVEKYGKLMSKDDSIIKASGSGKSTTKPAVHKVPGFLKYYEKEEDKEEEKVQIQITKKEKESIKSVKINKSEKVSLDEDTLPSWAQVDDEDDLPSWAQVDELPSWAKTNTAKKSASAAATTKGAKEIAKNMKNIEEADKFIDNVATQQEQDNEAVRKLKATLEAEGVTVDDKMLSIIKSLQDDTPTSSPAPGDSLNALQDLERALLGED